MENETKKEVTIELILSVFKNFSDAKRLKDIKNAVVAALTPDGEIFLADREEVENQVAAIITEDKKLDNESWLTYRNGKYSKRKKIAPPPPGSTLPIETSYIGMAGECAVMSELLFRGYNVNRMLVDDGVDIVAVRSNIYYYIQVKTTTVKDNGAITCSISRDRHDQYVGQQMRYIIVARTKDKGTGTNKNIYFLFTPQKLDEGIYQKCINVGPKGINIKIRFNDKTGQPVLYDDKEMNIDFCMNNFKL